MNNTSFRIIPRLDIKGNELVKGINLDGLRVLGKPEFFAQTYYNQGADEIFFQDVVASLYDMNSLHELISRIAKKIFIPLTVGGGIRTILDIKNLLRAGADKVSINTAAVKNPNFIKKAVKAFGSSTISISIETIEQNKKYLIYTDSGREHTGIELTTWIKKVQSLGAGEISVTFVNSEGTGQGFDLDIIKKICDLCKVPLIIHGGAGNKIDVLNLSKIKGVDGVCLSSILHYKLIENYKKIPKTDYGNKEYLTLSQSVI
jgi:imidazole glycerol-phosphate synthase subunit HisF